MTHRSPFCFIFLTHSNNKDSKQLKGPYRFLGNGGGGQDCGQSMPYHPLPHTHIVIILSLSLSPPLSLSHHHISVLATLSHLLSPSHILCAREYTHFYLHLFLFFSTFSRLLFLLLIISLLFLKFVIILYFSLTLNQLRPIQYRISKNVHRMF